MQVLMLNIAVLFLKRIIHDFGVMVDLFGSVSFNLLALIY